MSKSTDSASTQLLRQLGPTGAFVVCIGSVIGSGIFLVASDIATAVDSPFYMLLVWLVAGVISLAGALLFAELGVMFPRAGGQYVFLREAFHPLIAFLFGWTLIFVIQSGSIAAVAAAFARFTSNFYPMTNLQQNLWATVAIILLSLFNFVGIKRGGQALAGITISKIFALLLMIMAAMFWAEPNLTAAVSFSNSVFSWSQFGVALVPAFWAFDGWYALTLVAGEVTRPERNIPRATLLGIAVVTGIYMLVNGLYLSVMPVASVQSSSFVAADAMQTFSGDLGVNLIGALVILSVIGCLNAMILSGARVIYAMAKDGVLPRALAVVSPKTHSPNRALLAQMAWSVLLVWSGRYDQLFTYVIFAAFIFYGLTAYAVIHFRRQRPHEVSRTYRAPFYPWLPIFYVIFCLGFTVNSLATKPTESVAGLAIVLSGLPAFYLAKKLKKN